MAKAVALLAVVVIGCSWLVTAAISQNPPWPSPDTENPPLYPGATRLADDSTHMSFGDITERTIMLETHDPAELVLAFYRDALGRDHWLDRSRPEMPDLHYVWSADRPNDDVFDDCDYFYALHVTATPAGGQTRIELRLHKSTCR